MDYFKVIKRAVKITWSHKSTWLFGILLAVFQGRSGFNSNFNFNSGDFDFETAPGKYPDFIDTLLSPVVLIVVIALILFLVVLSIFVGFLARAALIGMVNDVEKEESTSVNKGFSWGWSHWLSLFGINLAIWIPFTACVLVLVALFLAPGIAGFVFKQIALGIVFLILGILLLLVLIIPTALGFSMIETLAERFRVIEKKRISESISQGYQLLRSNLGTVLLFWLIMLLIGFGLGMALLPVTLLLFAPAIALIFVNVFLGLVLGIPGLLVLIFLGGLIQTFTSAAWTVFFLELKQEKVEIQQVRN